MVDKFNIHWQIVRVKAKDIKDVRAKIDHVLNFLQENASKENYARVKNWLIMTRMGYSKFPDKQLLFTDAIAMTAECDYDEADNDNDLTKVDYDDLLMVQKDLNRRKYGFQFSKVPASHKDFMLRLNLEINNKNYESRKETTSLLR